MTGQGGVQIPPYNELMWPTLLAVKILGHSAKNHEIDELVIEEEDFSDEQIAVLHNDGPRSELEYRLAWARTYLKRIDALDNPVRGTWVTTQRGRTIGREEVELLWKAALERRAKERRQKRKAASEAGADPDLIDGEAEAEAEGWREELLAALLEMAPAKFERLSQRLLREAGFVDTEVKGRSGDGGIDGVGVLQVSLVSFPVIFQCKRYRGSVGPAAVRDLRGAMQGRVDRGLLITTGTFTKGAREEATRDGVPPIELIDSERLCDLLKQHRLGVETTTRVVEEVRIHPEFFADLT
jgi:restriction system protein